MTDEELKVENEGLKNQIEIDKKAICDQLEINEKLKTENAELKEKLCDILTKIDCFLSIKSTIHEGELYDLQQLIKNNGFKFKNDRWELAE